MPECPLRECRHSPERSDHTRAVLSWLPVASNSASKEIEIDQKEVIRKNAELNLIAKVPSVLGTVTHFCKIEKKRICDEKDLSAAYVEAQVKKLPLLFLYIGTISKKAQELLESKVFENVIVKKVE